MFAHLHQQMEIYTCTLEIEQNGNLQSQTIEAPRIMLEQQFADLVQQASQVNNPVKIKMSRQVPIYNNYDDEWVDLEHWIIFENNSYTKQKESNDNV